MKKIALFFSEDVIDLQNEVNYWLEKHPEFTTMDFQFVDSYNGFVIMIVFVCNSFVKPT